MKHLEKNDLIINEIYIQQWDSYFYIFKLNTLNTGIAIQNVNATFFKKWYPQLESDKPLRKATIEEKHWLKTCITADKFITFEKAMKKLIPEYIEAIRRLDGYTIGKTYKTLSSSTKEWYRSIDDKNRENGCIYVHFKPSTKEAYDAQFVVKDEFVLPEKWTLFVNKENHKVITDYINKIKPNWCWNYKSSLRLNSIKNSCSIEYGPFVGIMKDSIIYGTEITFEQFKKYVLKEQLEEPKDKILEKEGIDLNIGKIIRVESSEGAIFELGDKVTVFTKDSPNKGKVFTIKGFRWNNAKTNICAITELHGKNGIGLDKIELYSEPKQIVEDFKLPETWWITIENKKQLEIAKQYFSQFFNNLNVFRVGKTVGYVKNILDNYSANAFNLLTTTKMNNPQITFEQFEQYVLHNGFKVGDRFNKIKSLLNHTAPYTINEKEIIDLQYINNESIAFYKHVYNNYSGPQSRILTKNIVK